MSSVEVTLQLRSKTQSSSSWPSPTTLAGPAPSSTRMTKQPVEHGLAEVARDLQPQLRMAVADLTPASQPGAAPAHRHARLDHGAEGLPDAGRRDQGRRRAIAAPCPASTAPCFTSSRRSRRTTTSRWRSPSECCCCAAVSRTRSADLEEETPEPEPNATQGLVAVRPLRLR